MRPSLSTSRSASKFNFAAKKRRASRANSGLLTPDVQINSQPKTKVTVMEIALTPRANRGAPKRAKLTTSISTPATIGSRVKTLELNFTNLKDSLDSMQKVIPVHCCEFTSFSTSCPALSWALSRTSPT